MASDRHGLWVERLRLTDFRNYAAVELGVGPDPVVLTGPNGSGKTNLLEALSLLVPGQGLRRAPFPDLARAGTASGWSVAAHVHSAVGPSDIGTGLVAGSERTGRIVRIDGATQSGSGALADYVEMLWLTPAMDGLFTGPASDRRRFLDRLILCFDKGHARRANAYERAMASRNRLLADGSRDDRVLEGFEIGMAEAGVAMAATRVQVMTALADTIAARRQRGAASPFPWASIAIEGTTEAALGGTAALDVEDRFRVALRLGRERDRAAGRALEGPHRSDLAVEHGPKAMPARLCSTGEQKALLVGLILAHADLLAQRQDGRAPILLLDEVTAHLDEFRRAALLEEIVRLGAQAWMTGTDAQAFSWLEHKARFGRVDDGGVTGLD